MCAGSGTWTTKTATVACRQLGYSGLSKLNSKTQTGNEVHNTFHTVSYGSECPTGPGPHQIDGEVRLSATCNGTENRLKDCGDGVREMTCGCGVRAYLECEPGECYVKKHKPCTVMTIYTIIQVTVLVER